MVKLVAMGSSRMYGPREQQHGFEYGNALAYLLGSVLLLISLVLMAYHGYGRVGVLLLVLASALIALVNLHDLYAQLAGVGFDLRQVQVVALEIVIPLLHAIGGLLLTIAGILAFQEAYMRGQEVFSLSIATSVFWLVGSMLNTFQGYSRSAFRIQMYQNSVYIPLLIGTMLFLISSILCYESWPHFSSKKVQNIIITSATIGSILLVVGAVMNIIRVHEILKVDGEGGAIKRHANDSLSGPLLEEHAKREADQPTPKYTYKDALL